MRRRSLLQNLGLVSGSALLPVLPGCGTGDSTVSEAAGRSVAFRHGVASGDPLADRVILWTRVTSDDETEAPVTVRYRVARDPDMQQLLLDERVITDADRDFTVKVDPVGLQPGTTYYYQFEAGGVRSPVGRTRTLPVGAVDRLRIGFTSCANYPQGFFNSYRHMAERADLDAVLHLGDYLYEGGGSGADGLDRAHSDGIEIVNLRDYRRRHAQYRSDTDLQAMTRQHPMIAVWDDHESTNNSWEGGAQNHQPESEGDWFVRKANAIKAYFEWIPIRLVDPDDRERIWRQFVFGDLVDLLMLDTRLYGREEQLGVALGGPRLNDPERQLLGGTQERWTVARLAESQARWKLLGQQVMFGQLRLLTLPDIELLSLTLAQELLGLNADQWDGYPAARSRIFDAIDAAQVDNTVVLTGDIHSSWGIEAYRDPGALVTLLQNISGDPLDLGLIKASAVEFVSPSVTSSGFPPGTTATLRGLFRLTDPHIRYFQGDLHGYVLLDITPDRCQAEWWYADSIVDPMAGESFGKGLFTNSGENRLRDATEPTAARPDAPPLAP